MCFRATWDEHVFELTLPRSCCVGHVDIKFSLHAPCPTPPLIQVTLLKQNASGIGRKEKVDTAPPVDRSVDFNLNMQCDAAPLPGSKVDEEAAVHVLSTAASAEDPNDPPPVDANYQPGPFTEPQRLASNSTYEEYIAADDDITVWGTLNAADIIREQQESSDEEGEEEMEEELEDIPTMKDVLKAGDAYSRALKRQGASENLWSHFYNLKDFVEKTGAKKKQASIMDFKN
uniref:Uncharacterized protein n=1 Tax=Timema shepardi TaxID=629360 RepID=A0A7R9AS25_TIMSH|nr:unnamed protein product [Timema shepardi]